MATHEIINGHYTFDGYTNTKIFYQDEAKLWRMELFEDSSIHATTESSDYPFGIHQWKIVTPQVEGVITLSLNGCNEEKEFNCNDGVCIAIGDRYSEARLLVPWLMVQPSLLFKIGREWNGMSFHEVKLLG